MENLKLNQVQLDGKAEEVFYTIAQREKGLENMKERLRDIENNI